MSHVFVPAGQLVCSRLYVCKCVCALVCRGYFSTPQVFGILLWTVNTDRTNSWTLDHQYQMQLVYVGEKRPHVCPYSSLPWTAGSIQTCDNKTGPGATR